MDTKLLNPSERISLIGGQFMKAYHLFDTAAQGSLEIDYPAIRESIVRLLLLIDETENGLRLVPKEYGSGGGGPDPVKLCANCGKDCTAHFWMCDHRDEIDTFWCPDCFNLTPCGRGDHGEGCPTQVFGNS